MALMALTPGCTEFSDRSPYWATIRRIVPNRMSKEAQISQRARELPYASLEIGFGSAPQALMVLESVAVDGTLNWAGSSGQLITTHGPLVTRVLGLDVELFATTLGGEWQMDLRAMVGRQVSRQLRFRADRQVDLQFDSTFERDGMVTVDLLDGPRDLLRIHERVSAAGKHRFSNSYDVDPLTGFCWSSRQTAIPAFPALRLKVMRPFQV